MNVKEIIKNLLLGIDFPQEYLCLGLDETYQLPQVRLQWSGNHSIDVTHTHLFLGYKPLIIGIPLPKEEQAFIPSLKAELPRLVFSQPASFGEIRLEFSYQIAWQETSVLIFEGKEANHHLLSDFHQMMHRRMEGRIKKANDPLQLSGNLYDQVRLAYSFPRYISLIALEKEGKFNVFPTDLNGPVDKDHYLISLRHEGKACAQVDDIQRMTISQITPEAFQTAYQMGKNHMKDLQEVSAFDFKENTAETNLPVPDSAIAFRELKKIGEQIIGIHKILEFEIVSSAVKVYSEPALAHIHRFYAQWRKNHGLADKYLIR